MKLVKTADGSFTLFNAEVGEHYHSKHGALQESQHVFLKSGLQFIIDKNNSTSVSILEVGFGTGLNFLLTADYCHKNSIQLDYVGIEKYPLDKDVIIQTGNTDYVSKEIKDDFLSGYQAALKEPVSIGSSQLRIEVCDIRSYQSATKVDVIYFDAFAAIHQPEMWLEETLADVCENLLPGGVFVTYAITGNLKRSMKSLGFTIEKIPGAPGKREMLRAIKI